MKAMKTIMPIRKRGNKWHWGSKGPFDSRKKAAEVARAAHASGYEGSIEKFLLEKDNVPISDWIKRIQSRGQQQPEQPEQPVPAPTPPPKPEGYSRAIGGGITGNIDFNEMLPDPSSVDPDTGINYHPDHPWWNSRDGTISQWRKNTVPRYWYHMPNVAEFEGAPDGGVKAYSSSGSSFKHYADMDEEGYDGDSPIAWLSQIPYQGDSLGSPSHKKYGDAGPPSSTISDVLESKKVSREPLARGERLADPRLHQYHNMPQSEETPNPWNVTMANRRRGLPGNIPYRGQQRHIRIIDITKLNNSNLLRSGLGGREQIHPHNRYLQHSGDIPLEAIVNPFEAIDATEQITHYINKEDDLHVKSVLANGQVMGKFLLIHIEISMGGANGMNLWMRMGKVHIILKRE